MRIEATCLSVSEKTIHIINNKDAVGIEKETQFQSVKKKERKKRMRIVNSLLILF